MKRNLGAMAPPILQHHLGHRLSEYGFGVSIRNDSKYDFTTCGNLMRLNLSRVPKASFFAVGKKKGVFFNTFY